MNTKVIAVAFASALVFTAGLVAVPPPVAKGTLLSCEDAVGTVGAGLEDYMDRLPTEQRLQSYLDDFFEPAMNDEELNSCGATSAVAWDCDGVDLPLQQCYDLNCTCGGGVVSCAGLAAYCTLVGGDSSGGGCAWTYCA